MYKEFFIKQGDGEDMNKKSFRQCQLFKLLSSEKEYRSSRYFSEILAVSTKTVYNDMNKLNEAMKEFDLFIEKKPSSGFLLIGEAKNRKLFEQYLLSLQEEKTDYFTTEDRQIDIVCNLLRSKKGILQEELEEKYYISDSTLRLDLEQIRGTHSMQFFGRNRGRICLKGDEASVQYLVKNYLMEKIPWSVIDLEQKSKVSRFFTEDEVRFAKESLKQVLVLSNAVTSDYYMNSLFFFFLVFGIRVNSGFHYCHDVMSKEDLSMLETYFISYELTSFYHEQFGLELTKRDIQAINEQLYANGIYLTLDPETIDPITEKTVDNILRNLGNLLKVDISDDVELKRSLMAHIPPMVFRLKRNMRIENPLLGEIKKQYLLLFSLLWYVLSDLEEQYDIRLNDDEISFLLIYFQVSLEKRHGVYFKNIVIVCPRGLSTSELLYTKVRGMIPMRDRVLTRTVEELYDLSLDDIDFIISTVYLDVEEVPVVYVSPLLTGADAIKIMDEYANQDNQYKSIALTSKSTIYKNIDTFIDEKYIFCKKNFSNKQECLDFLIEIYEKEGTVSEKFRQSVYDREAMGDTSIYTGVGIPHAAPETIQNTKISFVTLEKPIQWGANEVSFIVLLAISNKDVDLAREIIKKIFSMAEDKAVVERINRIETKIQLISAIRNEVFEQNR